MAFPVLVSVIGSFFPVAGYQPAAQPPTWRTRGCSSSGLCASTNPAWLDLPGTAVPTGTALRVIEAHKLHHHYKVSAQGDRNALDVEAEITLRVSANNPNHTRFTESPKCLRNPHQTKATSSFSLEWL